MLVLNHVFLFNEYILLNCIHFEPANFALNVQIVLQFRIIAELYVSLHTAINARSVKSSGYTVQTRS